MSEVRKCEIVGGDKLGGSDMYQVLVIPDVMNVWLTEPEDRTFYRDLKELVTYVDTLRTSLAHAEADNAAMKDWMQRIQAHYDEPVHVGEEGEKWLKRGYVLFKECEQLLATPHPGSTLLAKLEQAEARVTTLEKELALIRVAAYDGSLSDAVVRVIASGVDKVTQEDIEWARKLLKENK
jgi:hypothetical protein